MTDPEFTKKLDDLQRQLDELREQGSTVIVHIGTLKTGDYFRRKNGKLVYRYSRISDGGGYLHAGANRKGVINVFKVRDMVVVCTEEQWQQDGNP